MPRVCRRTIRRAAETVTVSKTDKRAFLAPAGAALLLLIIFLQAGEARVDASNTIILGDSVKLLRGTSKTTSAKALLEEDRLYNAPDIAVPGLPDQLGFATLIRHSTGEFEDTFTTEPAAFDLVTLPDGSIEEV